MGLLKTLLVGRPNGLRAQLRGILGLKGATSEGNRGPDGNTSSGPGGSVPPLPNSPTHEPAEKALRLHKEAPRDVTPPVGYEVVLHKDALEPGKIIEVIIGGTAIAVARVGDQYYAISNKCPHADGPLGEGTLDGHIVSCPYHGWTFDVRDGACKTNPYALVPSYPVQVVGTAVCVKM